MALLAPPLRLLGLIKLALAPANIRLKERMAGTERLLSTAFKKKRVSKNEVEVEVEESTKEVKIEGCGNLQSMTIHQLRTISKSFGISARGSKRDLLSALKCFLDNEKDGPTSPIISKMKQTDMETSPSITVAKNSSVQRDTTSKRKAKNLKGGDQEQSSNLVAEVSGVQQKRRKGKPSKDDSGSLEVNSESIITKQNISIKVNIVSDKKPSSKRKGLPSIEKEDAGSTNGVELSLNSSEPWTILAHKKPEKGWIPYNPRTMRPPPLEDGTKFVKLISWNVNGLRALLKLDSLSAFSQMENFDILCLQETKLQEKDVEKIKNSLLDGYENSFWTCSVSKLGYSGTAVISRIKPLSVKYGLGISDHDTEGRLVTLEFEKFHLVSGYVPNSGEGLKRLTYRTTEWDPSLANYVKELEKSKPVVLTGDLNCAHQEIDIFNPAGNKRSAGFTNEERESFEMNFLSKGFVDTFRRQHPDVVGYTYWGFRHGLRKDNKGWRLDYFLVSESIADEVHDSYIVPDVAGSDHCPIGLILKL